MSPSADLSSELAEARRRLAELEAVEAEHAHAAKVQDALYRIAELASAAQDMQEFYAAIHGVVGELMDARNFFIALYDEERQLISWPYFVDEREAEYNLPAPNQGEALGEGSARGTTAYVLRTGAPQLIDYRRYLELIEQGEIEVIGATSEEHDDPPVATVGGVSRLLEAARELLPGLDRAELVEVTARDRPGTPDNLPLVGPSGVSGVVLAAGHFRHGVLLAPLTARLVADHVETGAVDPALDPSRFAASAHDH